MCGDTRVEFVIFCVLSQIFILCQDFDLHTHNHSTKVPAPRSKISKIQKKIHKIPI